MLPVINRTKYRVTYGDTDQMGVVYYGNYARLYEIGRTEMIREMGMPYRELEEAGVMMPVYSVESTFKDVIRYDELITIETTVHKLPAAKMEFEHRILNESGREVHVARVVLVFLDIKTRRPVRAPETLLRLIAG